MATNRKFADIDGLDVVASHPTTPASGGVVKYGSLVGVAKQDEDSDGGTVVDFGPAVYNLSVRGHDGAANAAIAVGDVVYYDESQVASNGALNANSGGVPFGVALEAVSTGTTATIKVALVPSMSRGFRTAHGVTTPTGGSDTIATGLETVVAVVVSLEDEPTLTHMWSQGDAGDQAGSPAAGSFILTSSKPTATNDVTPIAATTPWSPVHWFAIGT